LTDNTIFPYIGILAIFVNTHLYGRLIGRKNR